MARLPSKLSYANVMATIAVFIALGGSSYAAVKVSGKNVKDRSLTALDVKKGSLTTTEVRNGTLLRRDFAAGQLLGGTQGPKGDKGDKGDTGGVDTTILWAVVKADATLARHRHALSSARLSFGGPPTTGAYVVRFDRNVSQCAYSVTEGGDAQVVSAGVSDPHQIQAHPSGNGADSVLVTSSRRVGAGIPDAVDIGFHLVVAC